MSTCFTVLTRPCRMTTMRWTENKIFDDDTDSHSAPCTATDESGRFMNFSLLLVNYLVNLNLYSPHTSDAAVRRETMTLMKRLFFHRVFELTPAAFLLRSKMCRRKKKFFERSLRGVKNYYFISFVWVNLFLTDSNDRVLAALKFSFFGCDILAASWLCTWLFLCCLSVGCDS